MNTNYEEFDKRGYFKTRKIIPLVYDDSLSFYEWVNKLIKHINDYFSHAEADFEAMVDEKIAVKEDKSNKATVLTKEMVDPAVYPTSNAVTTFVGNEINTLKDYADDTFEKSENKVNSIYRYGDPTVEFPTISCMTTHVSETLSPIVDAIGMREELQNKVAIIDSTNTDGQHYPSTEAVSDKIRDDMTSRDFISLNTASKKIIGAINECKDLISNPNVVTVDLDNTDPYVIIRYIRDNRAIQAYRSVVDMYGLTSREYYNLAYSYIDTDACGFVSQVTETGDITYVYIDAAAPTPISERKFHIALTPVT